MTTSAVAVAGRGGHPPPGSAGRPTGYARRSGRRRPGQISVGGDVKDAVYGHERIAECDTAGR